MTTASIKRCPDTNPECPPLAGFSPWPSLSPAQLGMSRSPPQHGGFYGVGHQHGNGQRADASGDGRDRSGDFGYLGVNVANQSRAFRQKRFFALFVSRKDAVEFLSVGNL